MFEVELVNGFIYDIHQKLAFSKKEQNQRNKLQKT